MLRIQGLRARTGAVPIVNQITAKKALAVVAIFAVVCFGILGALAVIPHAHGSDLNHSHHKDCPIYQLGLSNVHADIAIVNAVIALFLFSYLVAFQKVLPIVISGKSTFLRGPPVLS